ncbi:MAG: tripartite tricarboxylate transporter substrate binding protein [Betaproteobacteria bacterium]|nr:tripartite tricarboxylate transporter substrate binding protein [Betaproteobacteria bacterium]
MKKFLFQALLALGLAGALLPSALAQGYPNKPIRLIVPFPPGGGNDVIGRIIAQKLTERFGQQVVVDNRAGANGIVGLQALMQSPPDGYTIGVAAAGPMAVNPSLYDKLPYDSLKDFAYVTNMVIFPLILITHPSVPAKTTQELVNLAKAKPKQIFFATPGSGNSAHLAGELLNSMANIQTVHVPYKGQGPAMADLVTGQVQMMFASIPSVLAQVKSGQVNAIAMGSAKRVPSLPDIPTLSESGVPGFEAYSWVGILAPAKTPKDIITKLNKEIVDILKQKEVADMLNQQGALPVGDTPEQFAAYVKAEINKWGAVIKSANIKAD